MYSMLYIIRDWTKNTKVINIINATFEIITFNIDLFQGNVVSHNLLVVSEKINSDQTKLIPSNGSCCSSCHVHCHNGCCVHPCTCSHHPGPGRQVSWWRVGTGHTNNRSLDNSTTMVVTKVTVPGTILQTKL